MRSRVAFVLAVLVCVTVLLERPSRAAPSDSVMTFQTRITQDGNPLNGDLDLRFEVWSASSSSGTRLWYEDQDDVPVRNGIVSARLGSVAALTSDLFAPGTDRYVAVKLRPADTDLVVPYVQLTAVPYALNVLSAGVTPGVPVGTIVDWFRPDTATAVPGGWLICDGTTVSDAASPFDGKAIPDLRDKFVMGLDATNAGGPPGTYGAGGTPTTGGANNKNLSHAHSISSDGAHTHTLPVASGYITYNPSQPNGRHATTNSAGSHNHTGSTGAGLSSSFDIRPAFVGLLKIIKIK